MPRVFTLLWATESVFDLGAEMMAFALGVWIFEQTGSAEQFASAVIAATAPGLLITPFAGSFADRFDRRWIIAWCDGLSALLIMLVAWLLLTHRLTIEHLYLYNAAAASISAMRTPAYVVLLSHIVPKDRLTHASGLVGMSQGLLQIGSPLLAGYLLGAIGLEGIVSLQSVVLVAAAISTFAVLSGAAAFLRGSHAGQSAPLLGAAIDSVVAAFRYLRKAPSLGALACYGVMQESLVVLVTSLLTPLVLSTHPSYVMGQIQSFGAAGALLASLFLVAVRVERRLMLWVLLSDAVLATCVMIVGFVSSPLAFGSCAFVALIASTISSACASAIWVRKTPRGTRGSMLALLRGLNLLTSCIVLLIGGKLGEHFFEPLLATHGDWAESVGQVIGAGKGRGLGLMLVLCGLVSLAMCLLALGNARLREFDCRMDEAPDDAEPSPTAIKAAVT